MRRPPVYRTIPMLLGVGRLVLVLAVLAGVPVLLVALAGPPVPPHLSLAGLHRVLRDLMAPPTAGTWHAIIAAACWLVWLWLLIGVLVESAARWRARRLDGSVRPQPMRSRPFSAASGIAAWALGPLMLTLAAAPGRGAPPLRAPAAPAGAERPCLAGCAASAGANDLQALSVRFVLTNVVAGTPAASRPAPAARSTIADTATMQPESASPAGESGAGHGFPRAFDWLGGALIAMSVEQTRRFLDRRHLRASTAGRAGAAPVHEPPVEHPPGAPGEPPGAAARRLEDPVDRPEVEVRLLGPVEIVGAPGPFDRPKTVETVVYLALNRDGAAKALWAEALWPQRTPSANSLNTALWQARRALGVSSSGTRHLPASGSVRLRLAGSVRTDVERFEMLVGEGTKRSLVEALSLVRGRLFAGLGDPDWLVLDGHAGRLEGAVASAALALGEMTLREQDPATASWAARQGLSAVPYDERLYRLAMRAAAMEGNNGAVSSLFDELCRVLEVDPSSLRGLAPETISLRTLRRPAAAVARP